MTSFDADLLDDAERLAALDREDFLRALASAGAQVRRATTVATESTLPRGVGRGPRAVVVAAMGADDLVADVAATLAAASSPIGITHVRVGCSPVGRGRSISFSPCPSREVLRACPISPTRPAGAGRPSSGPVRRILRWPMPSGEPAASICR